MSNQTDILCILSNHQNYVFKKWDNWTHMQKKKLDPYLIPYIKLNSK